MNEMKLFHTQLGFRPAHGKKRIIAPDCPDVRGVFGDPVYWVFHQQRFSQEPLNSPAQHTYVYRSTFRRRHTDFGVWYVGDFSPVRAPGCYQAYCGNVPGPTFALHDKVWCRILPELIRYFQIQSCGREAIGWHDACHLDDGYIRQENRWIDAVGGWHDAGDFKKHFTSTSMIAYSLLIAHRIWKGREPSLGLDPGIFLREALQGVSYFLGLQNPATGMLYRCCGDGDNRANRYTDNVRESGDERLIDITPALPAGKCTTLFAMYAAALRDEDPNLSARCLEAARKSLAYDLSRNEFTADRLQWRAWGYLELWRATGDDAYAEAGVRSLAQLLDLQVTDYIGGQTVTRGFFRAGPDNPGYHRKHIGADYPIWILGEFLTAWPGHPDAGRWRDAIALWVDGYARVFADRNPFGILPHGFYDAPPADHPNAHYRQLGDRLWFRYFMADNKFGNTPRSALSAVALAAAAKALNRPELLDDAYRLIEWVLGANPFQLSLVNGVGVRQACAHSLQIGNIPGGVMNGIGGDANDMPTFGGHPWLCSAGHAEYYGYNTSTFFWAVMALQDLSWPLGIPLTNNKLIYGANE